MKIWQMDGKPLKDVYVIQAEGFVSPENSNEVCKLQRSIYGLRQASRSWNLRFDEMVKEFDFIKDKGELCVYKKIRVAQWERDTISNIICRRYLNYWK